VIIVSFVLLLLGSSLIAVILIVSSALLDDVAPRQALTSAYTAMIGASLLTSSAGNALAGTLAQDRGPASDYAMAAIAVTAAAGWAVARRRTLSPSMR
jgi:hypothetical protein